MSFLNPPVREPSTEVANLIERKYPHTPVYGVKELVCLSVCYQIGPQLFLLYLIGILRPLENDNKSPPTIKSQSKGL